MKTKKTVKNKIKATSPLFKFLQLTKDGKYAQIEKTSIPYSRIGDGSGSVGIISCEEEYFYGLQ